MNSAVNKLHTFFIADFRLTSFLVASGMFFLFCMAVFFSILAFPSRTQVAEASALKEQHDRANAGIQSDLPVSAGTLLEMHIANDGLVFMRGARVTSVSGKSIVVAIAWGSMGTSWVVHTNDATHFATRGGDKIALSKINIGDSLTVTGNLNQGASQPTIEASAVRRSQ